MIGNPTIGQAVFFCFINENELDVLKGTISSIFYETKSVEIGHWYYRKNSEIFPTEELAQKNLKNEISKTLKSLNKEIAELSKKRENLASKLAKLLG